MQVKAVAYVGLLATDTSAWLSYCTAILGMMPARAIPGEGWGAPGEERPDSERTGVGPDGSVYLKMDERQWRVAIHPSASENGLAYLGLELDTATELDEAVRELRALDIEVRVGGQDEARARAVTGVAFLRDPSGNALELFYGQTADHKFRSPVVDHTFVAGHLGIGHFNLFVKNQAACFDFYTKVLGFRLSDHFSYGGEARLQFLHCNPRHHSVAMIELGGAPGLQHMLVEVRDIDAVGATLDRALKAGVEIISSLGRHRNDRMLSFYMSSPGGFHVEVGCEGRLLDDTWRANEFCEGDVWGHQGLMEAVQNAGAAS
jgi:3,4-dihydroxy-9,10-secoandrosta-1,3,5(10)-triene-9,17-dione 4,5-dioxygenase